MQIRISGPVPEGLTVFETMRAEADGRIALWPLHLDRLRRDCAAVGFALDEDAVARGLQAVPQGAALRLRLAVNAAGQVDVTHQTLSSDPQVWVVHLSGHRLDSGDPWLRIKTSHRPVHEAARAALSAGVDEAILLNERGEICEGSITNLFLRRDGCLLTPPLSCGLLPGVLRQSLLSCGEAREAILTPANLAGGEVFCGNALRGLIPARLAISAP